ncbi:MAG: FAD-binding oxidoreductase [Gammaproteobacteria bacterium]|nr:FAD-binding oxidoreductase [Gammaproteobacteria bacterium]MDH3468297.1 FAD-binding oxidoreductase [Gammaproteobacteria bacterium]
MTSELFTSNYIDQPFWWDRTPRPESNHQALPGEADVAIIGSGYTGLCAAIQTARGGRQTVVLDAEAAGWGCSSRNGGQVSTSLKPSYEGLKKKYGGELAFNILKEGHNALQWIGEFIKDEEIDCDFKRCGRFHAAHTPKHYTLLEETFASPVKGLETDSYMVSRQDQHKELSSDLYHGGIVHPRHASLDPARYHQGLLGRAVQAGADIQPHCKVNAISHTQSGFQLDTQKGTLVARDVVIATSGYTKTLSRWHQRRIIPIGSYMIATEPVPDDLIRSLIPNDRVISDTRKLVVYYRTCPERRRILFGARTSIKETDARVNAPAIHKELVKRFPELDEFCVSHSWMGFVGYTFDTMPHLGKRDGIYYSMGYCGSGISLASYFGTRIGQQVLGLAEGRSPLDLTTFQSRPYYTGNPWFLAPAIRYYSWLDNRPA